jgi:hypothetical protein
MQDAPPDILVTNFTMLEYILLRNDDQRLFTRPELFRFLVLDEVHTYAGTQGMEVSLLLRRLNAFLGMRSNGRARFLAIGTSATLPSGPDAKSRTAEFASVLFGLPFSQNDVICPTIRHENAVLGAEERQQVLLELVHFGERYPAISRYVGILDGEVVDVPEDEWTEFAQGFNPAYTPPDSPETRNQVWYRLADVLKDSGIIRFMRAALTEEEPACRRLHELAEMIFGTDPDARCATATLLRIIGAAHKDGTPLLSLRFHQFVNEPSAAQICLFPSCGTQLWWSRIYLSHRTHCDHCSSFVYPLVLCRRCGFVYLEGWRRRFPLGTLGPDLYPEPDDADDEAAYNRILFRPLSSGISAEAIEAGQVRTLCLQCGRWMVAESDAHFEQAAGHGCARASFIQVCSWEQQLVGGVLEECIFCEQHWIRGQDVATPPAPSVYATATVLVEELERGIERNGVAPFESKLISFSDSRQQAAQLAYRFQKTNREFTFRQLIWSKLVDAPDGVTTTELIGELCRDARDDYRLARLLLDDETRLHDRTLLERTIATLLFRECVTAYLTLEAQGLVRVSYDPRLFRDVCQVFRADRPLFSRLASEEQESFILFLLDWNMRFRYAVAPVPRRGSDIDWTWLERRNINAKSCVRSGAQGIRGELNFAVSVATGRNRTVNFCRRLYERINAGHLSSDYALSDLRQVLFSLWDEVFLPYVAAHAQRTEQASLFNIGRPDADGALLKINFDSLLWTIIGDQAPIYRCNACGRISTYSIHRVCPLRDCAGTLEQVSGVSVDQEQFSPVRHYRRLVRHRSIRPLRVEEHTAQVAPARRQAIEQEFRRTDDDSVDVICGSTTFELGIDLGTVHAVFMSNLPPKIANYRQRAGRAGRRAGMVPFILSYVRQRPHDQYFWADLPRFIAGSVPVPHLSITSREVIGRHANALVIRELMHDYLQATGQRAPLDGPAAGAFVAHIVDTQQIPRLQHLLTDTHQPLRREYEAALGSLPDADRPISAVAQLGERLRALRATYLPLRATEGAIAVLSDYGILPSYAFPLYVDELRLHRLPPDQPPRSELRLQRDRRIALQEYMPGKVIVAGKTLIASDGVWAGYEERPFRVCRNRDCQTLDFTANAPVVCPACGEIRSTFPAIIPKGGFFGTTVESIAEQDMELARQRGETYFDPANEPPPLYESYGNALRIAVVGAGVMEQSPQRPRMRQLNPRPHSALTLQLVASNESDLALPHAPPARCLRRSGPDDNDARRYHLMHEFTTDIIRLQVLGNDVGGVLASSPKLTDALRDYPDRSHHRFYWDCFRRSLGEALIAAASRLLDVDNAELGIAFHAGTGIVGGKEFVLFDTAPGGAGYARQLALRIVEIFRQAEEIVCSCRCGDSCYSCLRNYYNQMFHKRLDRLLVAHGLRSFNLRNWSVDAAAA